MVEQSKLDFPCYMIATKAIHQTGDISRTILNICLVYAEDSNNYIGNWITGFGL
jgi:hypothetical protein